jgi:antirestriction protein ArdC
VRKGEKASTIVKYGTVETEDEETEEKCTHGYLRGYSVFNADQVDGYAYPVEPELPPLARLERIDGFVSATGVKIQEGGTRACYVPAKDKIYMPQAERFIDTKRQTRTEAFYSTLFHELTHWSGAPHRLAREKGGRFGSAEYAFEELVAELGAAFLCARLQVTPEVREDHAQYIVSWLKALKGDKRFIFSAAAQAQLAADYLFQLSNSLAT